MKRRSSWPKSTSTSRHEGVHNLNWVSPSHVVPQAVEALALAAERGLRLPVVYNSNGYDSASTLRLLDGIVDVYLPDLKYADEASADELSKAVGYVPNAQAAIQEMWRQVGPLTTGRRGPRRPRPPRPPPRPAQRPVPDRGGPAFLARELGPHVSVSLMAQFHPCHRADRAPPPPADRALRRVREGG